MLRALGLLVLITCSSENPSNDGPLAHDKPAGSACAHGGECAGGTCLGAPGQPQEGNPRFAGGYCTSTTCTVDTQVGCGPDEWCTDGGEDGGGYCVEQCSKASGLGCRRSDHVCLGLGTFGGCFSSEAVECDVETRTGCQPAETCVRIGFEERALGRCETTCDPMQPVCPGADACYFIRTYSTAFCNTPGTLAAGQPCTCDKCCAPALACTPDGVGRTCSATCLVATGEGCLAGQTCVSLKRGSPWGGCR
jgi:hypothetical protein